MKRKHLPKKLREEKENLQTNEVEIFCQKKKNLRTKRREDKNLQTKRRKAKTPTDRELQRREKPFDKEKRKEPTDK